MRLVDEEYLFFMATKKGILFEKEQKSIKRCGPLELSSLPKNGLILCFFNILILLMLS